MKKILAVFLATTMILSATFCTSVSASTTLTPENELDLLTYYNEMYFSTTGICKPFELGSDIEDVLGNAQQVLSDSNSTDEDYLLAYENLINADYNFNIDDFFAKEAYELALAEQNYNNWYSEEDWADFVSKRDALKTALDTKISENITETFYDMLYSYNVMTNRYTVKGDINKDGVVNVLDATLLQKYLVNRANLTGAQKMLTCAYNYEDFDISAVTTIQKYSVNLVSEMPNNKVFISDFETYESDERIMERAFNFIICPRTNDGMYELRNGFYDTQFLEEYYMVTGKNNK